MLASVSITSTRREDLEHEEMASQDWCKDFDPEVNRLYMPSMWSPRGPACVPAFFQRLKDYSKRFCEKYEGLIERVSYGDGPQQILEIVRPKDVEEEAKVVCFIHGGYWVVTSRDMYVYVGEPVIKAGHVFVNIGYDQAPKVSMPTMVKQIRDAYVRLSELFPKSESFTFCGHSAGGHLLGMLLATDWPAFHPNNKLIPIKKAVIISGIPDLRQIIKLKYQADLKLTDEQVKSCSPLFKIPRTARYCLDNGIKVYSVMAQHDPEAFKEMCKLYTEALQKESVSIDFIVIPDVDHFEIVERFSEPDYEFSKYLTD